MRPTPHRNKGLRKKRYLLTNSHTTINTGSSHTPPRVDPVFAYRARARPVDEAIERLFALGRVEEHGDPYIAVQTLRKHLEAMEAYFLSTPTENVCLSGGRYSKVFLFWNKSRTLFKLAEVRYFHTSPPLVRWSLGMSSREQAFMLLEANIVRWLEFESLLPETSAAVPPPA